MRYLGIDFGEKRVGLALSDPEGTMGFPHSVLPNDAELVKTVAALTAKEEVGAIVVGASHNLSGKENPIAESARAFSEELTRETGIPHYFESEIYTTQEALRTPSGERGPKQAMTDASAAAIILTSFLSRHD